MADSEYPDSFADYPRSVPEERANRTAGGADVWQCRDALLAALRLVDSGEIEARQVAVVITSKTDQGEAFTYFQKCDSTLSLIGMYSTASWDAHCRQNS
jgi:hypothetical protein